MVKRSDFTVLFHNNKVVNNLTSILLPDLICSKVSYANAFIDVYLQAF